MIVVPAGLGAVVLADHGEVHGRAKRAHDRVDVGRESVRDDLRHNGEPCAEIGNEDVRARVIASAHVVCKDKPCPHINADEAVSLSYARRVGFCDAALLLPDVGLYLVALDLSRANVAHKPVMQVRGALPNAREEAQDRALARAGLPRRRVDRGPLAQRVNDAKPHIRAQYVGHKLTSPQSGGTAPGRGRPLSGYLMDVSITLDFTRFVDKVVHRDKLCPTRRLSPTRRNDRDYPRTGRHDIDGDTCYGS